MSRAAIAMRRVGGGVAAENINPSLFSAATPPPTHPPDDARRRDPTRTAIKAP